jgi:hypothetical protein
MNRRQFLSTLAAVPTLGPLSPAHAGHDPIKRSDVRCQGYVVLEHEAAEDPRATVPQYLQQLRRLIG